MSAKSKKSAAKKKNEKLKKKQAAKIARKAVIEKKAADDPSFKIKEDKKELAAQKKAEKREKKLLKKRELAKKKKQDLKPEKKQPRKKNPPDDGKKAAKAGQKDKAGGKKNETQAAPLKEDAPKDKKHRDAKQPAASEPGALLEAGSVIAPAAVPESAGTPPEPAMEPVAEQAGTQHSPQMNPEALPDEEETTVIEEVLEEDKNIGLVTADTTEPLPVEVGEETTVIDETGDEEIVEPEQADVPETLPFEEETAVIDQGIEETETAEPARTDVLEPLPEIDGDVTEIAAFAAREEKVKPPQTDVLEPLPPIDDEEPPFISAAAQPQPQTVVPEPPASDFEPVVFPSAENKTQSFSRRGEPLRWLTFAEESDPPGPLDEVLPNSALKLPRAPDAPPEGKFSSRPEPVKELSPHPGDIAAVPFDTLKYTSPQTALPQPPAQAPQQSVKRGKKAGEVAAQIAGRAALAPVTILSLSRRLYSFIAYQFSKLKQLSRKARIILLAVCLIAAAATGGGLLYSRLHYEIPAAAKPAYGGVNIRAADLRDIDEIPLEQQQAKADATKAKGDKSIFQFFASTDIIISEPADNVPVVLGNLEKNDCTFIISLVDREGGLMARTLGLPPGKYLPYITLIDRRLPYGEYDNLKLVVSAYDSDTLAYLGSQYTDFRLVIGIEDEAGTATPGQ